MLLNKSLVHTAFQRLFLPDGLPGRVRNAASNHCTACRKLYYFVQSKKFEFGLMVIIVANSALMATTYYQEPDDMRHAVEALNYAFTCMYIVEFLIKVGSVWQWHA